MIQKGLFIMVALVATIISACSEASTGVSEPQVKCVITHGPVDGAMVNDSVATSTPVTFRGGCAALVVAWQDRSRNLLGQGNTLNLSFPVGSNTVCATAVKAEADCRDFEIREDFISTQIVMEQVTLFPDERPQARVEIRENPRNFTDMSTVWLLDGLPTSLEKGQAVLANPLSLGQHTLEATTCANQVVCHTARVNFAVITKPEVRIEVFGLLPNGGTTDVRDVMVWAIKGTRRDSTQLPSGRGEIITSLAYESGVMLCVGQIDATRTHYTACDGKVDQPGSYLHRVVLPPTCWLHASGVLAGQCVSTGVYEAFERKGDDVSPFIRSFYMRDDASDGAVAYRDHGWPVRSDVVAIPVVFDRQRSKMSITAADSVAAWNAIKVEQQREGKVRFRPGRMEDNDTIRIVVIRDSTLCSGCAGYAFDGNGVIREGSVNVAYYQRFADARFWGHELAHNLAAGHECGRPSAQSGAGHCQPVQERTSEDITLPQILERIREEQNRLSGPGIRIYGLPQVHQGERWRRGLPVQKIIPLPFSWVGTPNSATAEPDGLTWIWFDRY